jgi:hypothetical protein
MSGGGAEGGEPNRGTRRPAAAAAAATARAPEARGNKPRDVAQPLPLRLRLRRHHSVGGLCGNAARQVLARCR